MPSQRPRTEPRLSLIVPAYNEAARLPATLEAIQTYLSQRDSPAEVIVVNDGSEDATAEIVRETARDWPRLRLIDLPHAGKGAAVRAGILAAQGELVAIADADLSMPIEELDQLMRVAEEGAVAIASREAKGSERVGEPWHRHLMGRVFNRLVQVTLLPGIEDTQCGFKCMPRAVAASLCGVQTINGWGFDVELLYLARLWGHTVVEVPITWYYRANSRIRLLRDTRGMIADVLAIRANARRGRYAQPVKTVHGVQTVP